MYANYTYVQLFKRFWKDDQTCGVCLKISTFSYKFAFVFCISFLTLEAFHRAERSQCVASSSDEQHQKIALAVLRELTQWACAFISYFACPSWGLFCLFHQVGRCCFHTLNCEGGRWDDGRRPLVAEGLLCSRLWLAWGSHYWSHGSHSPWQMLQALVWNGAKVCFHSFCHLS